MQQLLVRFGRLHDRSQSSRFRCRHFLQILSLPLHDHLPTLRSMVSLRFSDCNCSILEVKNYVRGLARSVPPVQLQSSKWKRNLLIPRPVHCSLQASNSPRQQLRTIYQPLGKALYKRQWNAY